MQNAICARPAAFVCSVFVLFSIFSATAVSSLESKRLTYALVILSLIFAVVFVAFLTFAAFLSRRRGREQAFFLRVIACALLFAAIGIALSAYFYGIRPDVITEKYSGKEKEICFTVEECKYHSSYSAIYYVNVSQIDGEAVSLSAILFCEEERDLSIGESASAVGDISEAEIYGDSFLSRLFYASNARYLSIDIGKAPFTDRRDSGAVSARLLRLRTSLSADIGIRLGRDEGGLVAALMLGDRSGLPSRVSSDFRLLGISHIIAISGMHLSLMIAAVELLFRRLRVSALIRGISVTVIAILYAALTGFSASVVRAVIMLAVAKAAPLLGRRGDAVTSLCVTVFAMMLLSPSAMTDVGLLLSFAATLGIVTLGERWQKKLDKACTEWERRYSGENNKMETEDIEQLLREEAVKDKEKPKQRPVDKLACICIGMFSYFASITLMSIAATLFTLPLVMFLFGSLSVLFLPANLIFVPLSTVLLIVSPFVLFFGIPLVPASIFSIVYGAVADLSRATMLLSERMAAYSSDMLSVNVPELLVTAVAAVGVFLILRRPLLKSSRVYLIGPRRAHRIVVSVTAFAAVAALLLSSLLYRYLWYSTTSVSFVTSGSDECVLLSDERDDVLIDISCGAKSVMKTAARMAENGTPDTIVLTHLRDLHLTVYKTLLVQMYLDALYMPFPSDDNERYLTERIVDLAKKSNTEVIFYSPGETLTFSHYTFTVTEYTIPKGKTHPVICFDLVPLGEGDTLSYIGGDLRSCAGVHERVTYPRLAEPDHLIIGGHDPIAGGSIQYLIPMIKTVLYGSETASEHNKNAGGPDTERICVYQKDKIEERSIELRRDN